MSRKVQVIVKATLGDYVCELALTRDQLETARLSMITCNDEKLRADIDKYRKMISIAARKKYYAMGRADQWVDFDRLKLEIIREIDGA